MVEAKTVDKKVRAAKKVLNKELKKQKVKSNKQSVEIAKLKLEMEKLMKKKVQKGHVSEYNFFIRKQILSGLTFSQAAKQWSKYKRLQEMDKRRPSAYNQFIGSQMRLGKTWTQAVALWKLAKAGKLGKKGSTRTITKNIYHTRTIKSKPKIKYRTRTITSKPTIKYRTKTRTIVRNIKSKPKIKYRTKTRTIFRNVKAKPVRRTVTRIVRANSGFDSTELRSVLESSVSSHSLSKTDLKEAFSADAEEIAFKIIQTYFMEIARLGFKRQLTLDEIINAYFYALARVKRSGIEMSEVEAAVRESGMKK
ncbi:MAG: hypothetical protein WCW44_03160 [archaeon]|jgi:hypothetical protein